MIIKFHQNELIETKTIESNIYRPIELYQNNDFYQFKTNQTEIHEYIFLQNIKKIFIFNN